VDRLVVSQPGGLNSVLMRSTKSNYLFDVVAKEPSRSMIFLSVDTLPLASLITVLLFCPEHT
jgi:hypothetical protein